MNKSIEDACLEACLALGVEYKNVAADGEFHNADITGDPRGRNDARIKLFPDGQGGIVCNWKTGETKTFFANDAIGIQATNPQNLAEQRRRAEQVKKETQEQAAAEAHKRWAAATAPKLDHPYLVAKRIEPIGIKQDGQNLIIPIRIEGQIKSLQTIRPDGEKRFLPGGDKKGGYCAIGGAVVDRVIVAEGYSTGVSVYQACRIPVAIAFGKDNLVAVAITLRKHYPTAKIVIAADDDWQQSPNGGRECAEAAAKAARGFVAIPVFSKDRAKEWTDFNDLHAVEGLEAVKTCIEKAFPVVTAPGNAWPTPIALPDARQRLGDLTFPLEALPPSLRTAVEETARFTKTDTVAAATIGLSVLATALGKKAKVIERDGLTHYPSLFFALIADSGERKSAVFRAMEEPLSKWEKAQAAKHKAEKAKAESMAAMLDTQIEALRKQSKKTNPDADNLKDILDALSEQIGELEAKKPVIPPSPKLYDTDATEQYLVKQLHRRNGAFAVLTPEGRPLVDHILGKYSGGDGMTGDGVYLNGISGDRITRGRVGDENGGDDFVIFDPCLNVCCMVQPDKYATLAGHASLRESGLVARIWSARLKNMVGFQIEQAGESGLQDDAMRGYWHMVDDVLAEERPTDEAGHVIPHKASLSSEAAELRRQFHNRLQEQMRDAGEYADVRAIVAKATSQTAKLALVLHCGADANRLSVSESTINGETWRNAEQIASYYLAHAVTEARAADEDVLIGRARRLLTWIERLPPSDVSKARFVTRAAILQSSPKPRPKAADADRILGVLEDFNIVRQCPKTTGKPMYEVNPAIYNN